jgi:hypothetical protein
MRIISVLLVVVSIMSITGCAAFGPKYSTVKNSIVPLSEGKGRIVFYRPSGFYGGGMRPNILLNGKKVGISRPGTVFYVDVDSGKHQVTVPAILYSGETTIDITISKNETVYVRNYMGGSAFGGRTNVEVVNSEQAVTEINELEFMTEPTK